MAWSLTGFNTVNSGEAVFVVGEVRHSVCCSEACVNGQVSPLVQFPSLKNLQALGSRTEPVVLPCVGSMLERLWVSCVISLTQIYLLGRGVRGE